jgi:hypothetical protein
MNPGTGHLVDLNRHPEFRNLPEYEPVPAHLHAEAVQRLKEAALRSEEAYVPRRASTPLSEWRRARMKEKAKAKRKAQKKARRRNRQ